MSVSINLDPVSLYVNEFLLCLYNKGTFLYKRLHFDWLFQSLFNQLLNND